MTLYLLYLDHKGTNNKIVYTTSKFYSESSFPISLVIIDEGRRLSFDTFELMHVAKLINRQMNRKLFNEEIKVEAKETGRGKCIYIYFENDNKHRKRHENFDGPKGVLAHSVVNGHDICFDFSERWTNEMFFIVAIHEILHSLGLHHSTDSESIMEARYKRQLKMGDSDVRNLKLLFPFLYKH